MGQEINYPPRIEGNLLSIKGSKKGEGYLQ